MKKIFIDPYHPDYNKIKEVAQYLKDGKIVALPTDTVYGLGVVIDNPQAISRLYSIKKRPQSKPFTIHLDSVEKTTKYMAILPPFGYRLIEKFWPGPLTIIYYKRLSSDENDKIGIRVPAHSVLQKIIKETAVPIYLPSANISGEKEASSSEEVEKIFKDSIDLIVDCGPTTLSKPSMVIDLTIHPFKILREGSIKQEDIVKVFVRRRILFICTGNTCRSVIAQFILDKVIRNSHYLRNRYEVISAGTFALMGTPPASEVIKLLKEKEDIDATNHQAKRLNRENILSSDLIITMEKVHKDIVIKIEPTAAERTFLLSKFLPESKEEDIHDPIGENYESYEKIYEIIKQAIDELIDWL